MKFGKLFIPIIASFLLLATFSCQKEFANSDPKADPSSLLLHAKRGASPGIYDKQGRYILLRGVNLNTLGDYWEGNPTVPATAPYDPDQFRIMASYGFNCVRLIFHWSKLEPEPGKYNRAYIQEISKAIEDAAKYGIYVMLDMHQDAWGKYIVSPPGEGCENPNKGWDGAPDWATITDGKSTCMKPSGSRESAPAVYRSWRNFWDNTNGIQDNCIGAWAELVKATSKYPTVVGYDILNEPSLGDGELDDQHRKMKGFYSKLTKAIRSAEQGVRGLSHIIFFENAITWAGNNVPSTVGGDFTDYDNIVFAPHNYFEVIGDPILTIEQGFQLYDALSKTYKTGMLIGEWGVFGDPATDVIKLKRFAAAEDEYLCGSTWWQWCQAPGDPHAISWDGTSYAATSMHLVEVAADGSYTGNRNLIYLNVLSRARPTAIYGKPLHFTSNADTGEMTLEARASSMGTTVLWIPGRFGEPKIDGTNISNIILSTKDGGYSATAEVTGNYIIQVSY